MAGRDSVLYVTAIRNLLEGDGFTAYGVPYQGLASSASGRLMMGSTRRRRRTMTGQPKEKLADMRRREESARQAALSKRLVEDLKDERRAAPDKKWAVRS